MKAVYHCRFGEASRQERVGDAAKQERVGETSRQEGVREAVKQKAVRQASRVGKDANQERFEALRQGVVE